MNQLPPWPDVDFAAFGEVEKVPLGRIQKLTAAFMARNWLSIPHVTHQDDADITDLEAVRKRVAAETGVKLSPLAFIVKAVAAALHEFPKFNASLDATGQTLIMKKYAHVGVAVDTPQGLLVPVIRDVDRKSASQVAAEIAAISEKARTKGLSMADMSGGCMTVSSLGGIGGTGFTPIINAPEVAILGVTKSVWQPRRSAEGELEWRLVVPLSLSYDHRVINGADAAKFTAWIAGALSKAEDLL